MKDKKIQTNDWYVYIVECSDSSLYTGITNNVTQRVEQHNKAQGSKYTKSKLPVKLVWSESGHTKSSASIRENRIKKLNRKQKLELL